MPKNVTLLLFDDVEVLDFAGPFEVFSVTNELHDDDPFVVKIVAQNMAPIRARNGLKILPDFTFESCPPIDILIIPGGYGTRALLQQTATLNWIRARAQTAEIVFSVCTGALVLAQVGLLEGLRITTHFTALDRLAQLAPNSIIDPAARFHDNGKYVTAAGISAGIDASLHLIDRLLGNDAVRRTTAEMEYIPR